MRLGIFEIEKWEEDFFKKAFPTYEIFFTEDNLSDYAGKKEDFDIISVFTDSPVNEKTTARFKDLKFVTTRSTGYEHLDLSYCEGRSIKVAYVPGYGDNTVAEFAFGLLLNLTRNIYGAIDKIKKTEDFSFEGLRGVDLKGKTIGIIGTGRIGKEAINIAQGFGMKVVAYDLYPDNAFALEKKFPYVSLEELLGISDFISIHTPFNPSTKHLINAENIGLLKKGVFIVNTARGGIIETEALHKALEDQVIAGVGLDVLEYEGDTKDELLGKTDKDIEKEVHKIININHKLMKMNNVLVTPHTAFNTKEAIERIIDTTIQNIKGFVAGDIPSKNLLK